MRPSTERASYHIKNEDELRLAMLGYTQEVKRIFSTFTNFGLAASMISILLGIIPLYSYSLGTGGPVVMVWCWIICGLVTIILVGSLAEICSAFPTMGALYYWAFRLGGPKWGPFASWTAGWCNLLGQIAGVASGGYAGAQIICNMISLNSGYNVSNAGLMGIYALVLILAGVVNTYTETLLTTLCYISVAWHIIGTLVIVIWMLAAAPTLQPASFVFGHFENGTGFSSKSYVTLIGVLFAASTFTGYDTAAHVAEETTNSHNSTPFAMLGSVVNAIVLGLVLIIGMNFCIQDINDLINLDADTQAYTVLWQQTVGDKACMFFLFIVFVAVECSNCANLTSASRMVYSFSRDGGLPYSSYLYSMNKQYGCPLRAIWLCVVIAFILGLPGLINSSALSALFSLTATGLYSSYMIPILLRVTIAKDTFKQAEFNLGKYSVPLGWISICWCVFMTIILCLPEETPVNGSTLNYSPLCLGAVILISWFYWFISARHWFKGALISPLNEEEAHAQAQIMKIKDSAFYHTHDPNLRTTSTDGPSLTRYYNDKEISVELRKSATTSPFSHSNSVGDC